MQYIMSAFSALFLWGCMEAQAQQQPLPVQPAPEIEEVSFYADALAKKVAVIQRNRCLVGTWDCGAYLSNCRQKDLEYLEICREAEKLCTQILSECKLALTP